MSINYTANVLADVAAERRARPADPALENIENGTGSHWQAAANEAERITAARKDDGSVAWSDVLLERVFVALSTYTPHDLSAELIRLVATVTAWVEDIDRKAGE